VGDSRFRDMRWSFGIERSDVDLLASWDLHGACFRTTILQKENIQAGREFYNRTVQEFCPDSPSGDCFCLGVELLEEPDFLLEFEVASVDLVERYFLTLNV